jgi:hypothetical protein
MRLMEHFLKDVPYWAWLTALAALAALASVALIQAYKYVNNELKK